MENKIMKELLEKYGIDINQQTIHVSGERMRSLCTDISGKWVPIEDVMKLLDRINELEQQIYGSK